MNIENEKRDWYLYSAKGETLGRLATKIADLLRGKSKTSFANNSDCGDYVVVTEAGKIVLTGKKEDQKRYYHHTGYIGNLKTKTVADLREKDSTEILKRAVYGMLPKNKLREVFMKRLKLYAANEHPHQNVKFRNS